LGKCKRRTPHSQCAKVRSGLRLERPKLRTGHLRREVGQSVLFFNGKLVLPGDTFGFFSLSHPTPNDTSTTK
jgi:hypothetical protein